MDSEDPKTIIREDECLVTSAIRRVALAKSTAQNSARNDRSPNRRGAGEDPVKRNQILDGARVVFTRMGFDGASMNDITREAGVSKGTIYVYFENKEELFSALIARQREALFGNLRQVLETGQSIPETLSRYGQLLALMLLSPEVILAQRAIIGIVGRMPDMGKTFYDKGPRFGHGILGEWLQARVNKGEMDIPDIEIAANQFVEMCLAGQMRARLFGAKSGEPDPDEIRKTVDSAVHVFCRAYGVR